MKKAFKVVLSTVGGIVGAAVLAVSTILVIPMTETVKVDNEINSLNWMEQIDDNKTLNQIFIPGTHDSGTAFVQLAYFSKCQGLNIKKQLEAGYRYLDMRLALNEDGDFYIQHGFTKCKIGWFGKYLTLSNVLSDCYEFLNENESETIIFSVKQEDGDQSIADFELALNEILCKNSTKWLFTNEIPSLSEARGKLVLMRRYNDDANLGNSSGIALKWRDQGGYSNPSINFSTSGDTVGSMNLYVQDRYEYDNEEKWAAFTAKPQANENSLVINFSSTKGHATFGHPYKFAKYMNPKLLELYSMNKPVGWTIIDFGDAKLAHSVYKWNFTN